MIDKQAFATRIIHSTKSQLVVINFELVISYLKEAELTLNSSSDDNTQNNNINNKAEFMKNIQCARNFLYELIASLDMKYPISTELFNLYNVIDQRILKFLYKEDLTFSNEAIELLKTIKSAFSQLDELEEDNVPLIQNAEVIYSGLTYNKNMTPTEFINPSSNRGFQA
ncbi:MAG: flagellar protein FliS [bacterium]